jgi:hypothetical protein
VNNRTLFHSGGSKPNCAAPLFNQRDSAVVAQHLATSQGHVVRSFLTGIKIAVARKLLTLVYYGLRDGHIRALARRAAWSTPDATRARPLAV